MWPFFPNKPPDARKDTWTNYPPEPPVGTNTANTFQPSASRSQRINFCCLRYFFRQPSETNTYADGHDPIESKMCLLVQKKTDGMIPWSKLGKMGFPYLALKVGTGLHLSVVTGRQGRRPRQETNEEKDGTVTRCYKTTSSVDPSSSHAYTTKGLME